MTQTTPTPPPAYPALRRDYPADFRVDEAYRASLPDLQNGPASLIVGARRLIQHVGISNFRLPIRYQTRDGGEISLETSVTGTVSLEADRKGINMSRIMRSFYGHADHAFSLSVLEAALGCLRPHGTLGMLGVPGDPAQRMPGYATAVLTFGYTIKGIIEGDSDPDTFIPELLALHRDGRFPYDRLIRTYPFDRLNEAVDDQHAGKVVKAVLSFGA